MPRFHLASFRRALLLAVAALALVAQPSAATPLRDGMVAYASGDFARAMQILRPLAEGGDADAQMMLGFMYHDGEGVPLSNLNAYVWFSLSISNSDSGTRTNYDAAQARDTTASAMTSADIKLATEMAYRCQAQHYKNCN